MKRVNNNNKIKTRFLVKIKYLIKNLLLLNRIQKIISKVVNLKILIILIQDTKCRRKQIFMTHKNL